eukprot:TRINITY_DN1965_c0_g1_i2.p1 TRINITY_DN1965_c0_g1~~TRINITY_DN1965_c0_g1_i2.p1  ORF type:complete len:466 (+),score=133.67 TRINITY_DN1965_c0_g1_i2:176-1573(+)
MKSNDDKATTFIGEGADVQFQLRYQLKDDVEVSDLTELKLKSSIWTLDAANGVYQFYIVNQAGGDNYMFADTSEWVGVADDYVKSKDKIKVDFADYFDGDKNVWILIKSDTTTVTSGEAKLKVNQAKLSIKWPKDEAPAPEPSTNGAPAGSPVAVNGQLQTVGTQIQNAAGDVYLLHGVSNFWSIWQGARFYTAGVVDWLAEDFNANVVRAAMAFDVNDPGSGVYGYLEDPTFQKGLVSTVVDAAIAKGMYAIIDLHSHHANDYEEEAIEFFQWAATKYGDTPNVLYEVFNEPLDDVSWSGDVKPYSQAVVDAIRKIDPDNIILIGSPHWSQDVDIATSDPVDCTNCAYTLHFYAGTHDTFQRAQGDKAIANGFPLLVSEWGTTSADGGSSDRNVYTSRTYTWKSWMDTNNVGHINWSVVDKDEESAILKFDRDVSSNGEWSTDDYTTSGTLVRNILRGYAPNFQ